MTLLRALFVLMLWTGASAAHALCVLPACTCSVATTGVAFGTYQPLTNTAKDSEGNVRVSCTGVGLVIPYTLALSTGSSGSYTMRTMRLGAYALNYNLYTDLNRTIPWTNVSPNNIKSGSIVLNLAGIGVADDHTIYGRLMAGQQTAVPGINYTDSITVTITYY